MISNKYLVMKKTALFCWIALIVNAILNGNCRLLIFEQKQEKVRFIYLLKHWPNVRTKPFNALLTCHFVKLRFETLIIPSVAYLFVQLLIFLFVSSTCFCLKSLTNPFFFSNRKSATDTIIVMHLYKYFETKPPTAPKTEQNGNRVCRVFHFIKKSTTIIAHIQNKTADNWYHF